jgi:hypothetical protein
MFRYDGSYDRPNFANLGYPATIELFRAILLPHVDHFTRLALNCTPLSLLIVLPVVSSIVFLSMRPLL